MAQKEDHVVAANLKIQLVDFLMFDCWVTLTKQNCYRPYWLWTWFYKKNKKHHNTQKPFWGKVGRSRHCCYQLISLLCFIQMLLIFRPKLSGNAVSHKKESNCENFYTHLCHCVQYNNENGEFHMAKSLLTRWRKCKCIYVFTSLFFHTDCLIKGKDADVVCLMLCCLVCIDVFVLL